MDVAGVSISGGRGVLPEDEFGVCGFGVGDLWSAFGGGSDRDHPAGDVARSRANAADVGAGAGDADRAGAVLAADAAGSCSATGRAGAGVEAVVVQRGSAADGVGGAISSGICGSAAAESVRLGGGGGGCDLPRSRRARLPGDVGLDRQADQQHADLYSGRARASGADWSAGPDLCWGSGTGAGVLAASGVDGGAVCKESVCAGVVVAIIQDWGCGTVPCEWGDRVCGAN